MFEKIMYIVNIIVGVLLFVAIGMLAGYKIANYQKTNTNVDSQAKEREVAINRAILANIEIRKNYQSAIAALNEIANIISRAGEINGQISLSIDDAIKIAEKINSLVDDNNR